jgi:hypothetical protein
MSVPFEPLAELVVAGAELVPVAIPPADRDSAAVYLASLGSKTSRRTMAEPTAASPVDDRQLGLFSWRPSPARPSLPPGTQLDLFGP